MYHAKNLERSGYFCLSSIYYRNCNLHIQQIIFLINTKCGKMLDFPGKNLEKVDESVVVSTCFFVVINLTGNLHISIYGNTC